MGLSIALVTIAQSFLTGTDSGEEEGTGSQWYLDIQRGPSTRPPFTCAYLFVCMFMVAWFLSAKLSTRTFQTFA